MKRIRIGQLSRQWLAAAPVRPAAGAPSRASLLIRASTSAQIRCQSTALSPEDIFEEQDSHEDTTSFQTERTLPSPHPDRATRSAKLAALHARLSLSSKIPIKVLARALVDPSADPSPQFNNANLAFVGASLLHYHTSEWLVMKYPRLPMAILFEAMKGYSGEASLSRIARAWGVEPAGAPGEEVDPGYLQYSNEQPTVKVHRWGYERAESKELVKYKWRRGLSSRIVLDDAFGRLVNNPDVPVPADELAQRGVVIENAEQNAHANFVRSVVGAVYLYCGSEAAKTFIKAHVLSRQLDLENLFAFKLPQRELTRLCARENFDPPVARLLSETGRMSRTPVFVVGIYSGMDKLGEAAGPSLSAAKTAAAINALKAWYLYSPGVVDVPSDTLAEDAAPWTPAYVDIGEIIS
ncbi:ribonuclease III [Xylariaceae sp. FL0594]|nr:ribonuclease III [Xylariaceae sp. FL0594]